MNEWSTVDHKWTETKLKQSIFDQEPRWSKRKLNQPTLITKPRWSKRNFDQEQWKWSMMKLIDYSNQSHAWEIMIEFECVRESVYDWEF